MTRTPPPLLPPEAMRLIGKPTSYCDCYNIALGSCIATERGKYDRWAVEDRDLSKVAAALNRKRDAASITTA